MKHVFALGELAYAPGGIKFIVKRIDKFPGEEPVLYGDKIVMFAYRCTHFPPEIKPK